MKRKVRSIQKKQRKQKKRKYEEYIIASLAGGRPVKITLDSPGPILEELLKEMGVKYEYKPGMQVVTYYIPIKQ
jgi:hypothetical protein